jgi:hypothetical protein
MPSPSELETAGLTTSVAAATAEEEKGGLSAAVAAVAAAAADVVGPAEPRASQGSTGRGRLAAEVAAAVAVAEAEARDSGLKDEEGEGRWKPAASAVPSTLASKRI